MSGRVVVHARKLRGKVHYVAIDGPRVVRGMVITADIHPRGMCYASRHIDWAGESALSPHDYGLRDFCGLCDR